MTLGPRNLCSKELGGEHCIHPPGHLVPDQHETPRGVKWSEPSPTTPAALAVDCPKCGAIPGESCVSTSTVFRGLAVCHEREHALEQSREPRLDAVNHPPHYRAENGLEAIDVIEGFGLGFNLGNVTKYVLRAGRKGGDEKMAEDLKKARWYLDREIGLIEQGLAKRGSNT